jgi:hypothetical protein
MTKISFGTSFFIFAFCAILFMGCETQNANQERIVGSWQGISWEVNGTEDTARAPSMVSFSFHEDETYNASLGNHSEAGVYRLQNDKLYTTADGMEEIMVQINLQQADTLVMLMNRMGVSEKLTLVRQ